MAHPQSGNDNSLADHSLIVAERSVLEHLAQGADLNTLLQEICDLVEDQAEGLLASVHLVEGDHLRHGAGGSLPEPYNEAIDGISVGEGVGSCGTAAFRNSQVIVTDIGSDPLWREFKDLAAQHGLRSCWSTPIRSESEVLGTFAMYYRDSREPQPAELRLADAAAHIARLVIEWDRTLRQRDEAVADADAARQRMHDLFMQAPAIIAVLRGPRHIFELANPLYQAIVGKRPFIGLSVAEALPEVVDQGFIGLLDQVYGSGEPFIGREVPVRLTGPDGTTSDVFVNFVYQPTHGPDGAVDGILVHAVDVTDLVRARKSEERSAERFRTLAEAMPQKIFTAQPDGQVDYFNRQWMEFTGLSFDQIKEWGWTQFIHPDDVEENVRIWQTSIESGVPFEFEHRFRRADGQYRWHLSRAHVVRGGDGAIQMWIGSNTDIDDQKRAADLLNETLRMRDEFLSAAAHDLKTPLTAVRGHAQLIRRRMGDDVSPAVSGSLDELDLATSRMSGLIDELLEIARIDAGQPIALNLRPTDLNLIVDAVVNAGAQQARRHTVLVEVDRLPIIGRWDSERLERAVTNLFSNAIKYSPSGGTIVLSTSSERIHSRQWAILKVRDSGIGISEADLPRLFTRFHRGSNVGSVTGTGIGLEAVRRIVEMHGGSVSVDSKLEAGSTFTVRLPMA